MAGSDGIRTRLIRNFSISAAGSVLMIVIGLSRTACLTKNIDLADYGRIAIILNFFAFLGTFLNLRIQESMYQFYPEFLRENNPAAMRGLLLLGGALSLALGLVITLPTLLAAPWISEVFYGDSSLATLLRIYAPAAMISTFGGLYTPILRLKDRFSWMVIPQVAGQAVTLGLLVLHLTGGTAYSMEFIVVAHLAGMVLQVGIPLVKSWYVLRPELITLPRFGDLLALAPVYNRLRSTLFHSNLLGYLKGALTPGDVFLLGLLSTPAHVALYHLAKQLTAPLLLAQSNLQTVLTPELFALYAQKAYSRLQVLIHRYLLLSLALGVAAIPGYLFAARPAVVLLSRPEYLPALPCFGLLMVWVWLNLVNSVFYPLGVSLNLLKVLNLGHLVAVAGMILTLLVVPVDSVLMAGLQAVTMGVICLIFILPVSRRLRLLVADGRGQEGVAQ